MPIDHHRRLIASVRRVIRTDPSGVASTQVLAVIDDAMVGRILELAMRIGESMFAVGASAHDVAFTIIRVADAYHLHGVQVDVTYNSITASYHRGDEDRPTTLLRVVRVASPDHAKLQRLQALVVEIDEGLELDAARAAFRSIRRTPFLYRPLVVIVARALLAVGVAIMFDAAPLIVLLSFVAALCAAVVQAGLARLQVPSFFSQIAGAFVTTMVALAVSALGEAGVDAFTGIRPSIIVASGIVLMLSGLTVVGAAQDAIDGFALTAGGRILDLTMQTIGVVLGILIGLELGRVLGFGGTTPIEAFPFGPLPAQLAGAAIVAVAVALFNGAGPRIILVSAALSLIAIAGYNGMLLLALHEAAASAVGALLASFAGILVARRLHVPSVAVTTAAIVPLVPGLAVFRGLLGLMQSDGTAEGILVGVGPLVLAASIGIALAAGASLGLYLGTPVRATLSSVAKSRARVRR
ncbi:threonine/serine ThrE exporter family protein [Microbacterium sp.]|uniref:threonine/serine ThrE exporter family protein n=1 Tax=Microbacterium sp. TaxID=51671 RepID=UPI0028122E84|nr:threonine/serine exporter family protein [Microbacterium sp.]